MQDRYRLVRRGRMYYAFDRQTKTRVSLETHSRANAQRLIHAKNESTQQPLLNQAIAKVYLAGQDPKLVQRTWREVMACYEGKGKPSTQERSHRAMVSKPFNFIRDLKLVDTTDSHFESVLKSGGASTTNYLRRLHNLAIKRGWLLQAVLPASEWPVWEPGVKRAVTEEEHHLISENENDPERKKFYQMLWGIGGAQSDVADLAWGNVNLDKNILTYFRKKTGEKCQLTIGTNLAELLLALPPDGYFFPRWRLIETKHRAAEFRRRCNVLGITGITLHSYRYSWAQRAFAAGYPERFAQAALGHKSKAVHRAYARGADVVCPALQEYSDINRSAEGMPMPVSYVHNAATTAPSVLRVHNLANAHRAAA